MLFRSLKMLFTVLLSDGHEFGTTTYCTAAIVDMLAEWSFPHHRSNVHKRLSASIMTFENNTALVG